MYILLFFPPPKHQIVWNSSLSNIYNIFIKNHIINGIYIVYIIYITNI